MGIRGRLGESWRAFAQAFRAASSAGSSSRRGSTLAVWLFDRDPVYAYRADGAKAVGIVLFVRWSSLRSSRRG